MISLLIFQSKYTCQDKPEIVITINWLLRPKEESIVGCITHGVRPLWARNIPPAYIWLLKDHPPNHCDDCLDLYKEAIKVALSQKWIIANLSTGYGYQVNWEEVKKLPGVTNE